MFTVQITKNLNGPRVWHTWSEPHTHGFLIGSTRMYTHTQYIYIRVCFTRVHACMANVASMLASYLSTS